MNKVSMLVVVASILVLFGCAKVEEDICVRIDGSSTVYPISQAVAEEFLKQNKEIKVTVGLSGTGGGFKKFARGEIDIVNASRQIKPSEEKLCKDNQIEYIELAVAIDGIAVVVNSKNDWVDSLTVAQLRKIWQPEAEGKVISWSDVDKSWPAKKITLYGPGAASGTFDYFTEVICGESGVSRGDYISSEDDNVVVHGVANDKYALGYFGLAYYQQNKDKLKVVAIDNQGGEGPILPTQENIEKGLYQPLSRPLFIYVNKKSAQKPYIEHFVKFYLKNVARLAKEVGYLPLPQKEYDIAWQHFQESKIGLRHIPTSERKN